MSKTKRSRKNVRSEFEGRPGQGWLLRKAGSDAEPRLTGPLYVGPNALSAKPKFHLVAQYDAARQAYDCQVQLYDSWEPVAQFTMPKRDASGVARFKIVIPSVTPKKGWLVEGTKEVAASGAPCVKIRVPELLGSSDSVQ